MISTRPAYPSPLALQHRITRAIPVSTPLPALLLLAIGLSLCGTYTQAGEPGPIEVRVSQADGFTYGELEPPRPIVMLPISSKVTSAVQARRLSAALGREAKANQFIEPAEVESLIKTKYLSSAFDSLVTTLSMVQPADSFTVLSTLASRFSARHALVPINVAIDRADAHYGFDVMFVLIDLDYGRPRIIMAAGDAINGEQAGDQARQTELEAQTFRAVLEAVRHQP